MTTLGELLDLQEEDLTTKVGNFKERARQRRRAEFPDSTFVGPYEEEGICSGIWGEQWLWAHRELIRGVVLDMSTPRDYHEYVYQLPAVEKVLISDLCDAEVEKFGHRSKVDIIGDFAQAELPVLEESFDTVLCMSILEHCEDPTTMVKNIGRLLRPGGVAFFRAPFAYIDGHKGPDYWRFCREGYLLMARKAGLEVLKTGQCCDVGKYFVLEIGENAAAVEGGHRGVPAMNWMICQKGTMMKVSYSYLNRQFADTAAYLGDIQELARSGDFTLGAAVTEFEERFAALCDLPYAIGVNSGTDALILSLKALGIGPGDEVITTPNTFVATVGAVAMVGARPVFVDNNDEYTIDASKIEEVITPKTKAILPVHLTGNMADMPAIMAIAREHNLVVVEDAAQAILASIDGKLAGAWGETACFSLHPLKNLNVWGDGGVIVTRSAELCEKLRLLRNHGLVTRDEVVVFGHCSRLDSLQAVIANRVMDRIHGITEKRIANAQCFDEAFAGVAGLTIPLRRSDVRQVFHTYVIRAQNRDALQAYLLENGIEAKIHYPVPVHLQKAAAYLGYRSGDFPVCEEHCRTIITLPVHQHLAPGEMDYVIEHVRRFYNAG